MILIFLIYVTSPKIKYNSSIDHEIVAVGPHRKCQRRFTRGFRFGQVFIVTTQWPHAMKIKTSGIQAFVTIGSSVFSLTSPSEIFRGRGYSFAGLYSVGSAVLEQTVKAFQISCTFLTTSII